MSQDLNTIAIGSVVFKVEDKTFICSSLSLELGLNQLPTAMVVIGIGSSILGDTRIEANKDEEYLIELTTRLSGGRSSKFVPCIIDVVKGDNIYTVFKGIIADVSYVYKTAGGTIRAMRVSCIHFAAELYASPLAAYSWSAGADMVTEILGNRSKETSETDAVGQFGMYKMNSLDDKFVCEQIADKISHQDIVTRIAYIAGAIVTYSSHVLNHPTPTAEEMKALLHIDDYMFSDYVLADAIIALNAVTDRNFSESISKGLRASIQGGSVLDAIIGMATSFDFLLTVVPHMSEDFKLELRPSMAWNTDVIHTLDFSDISSINSAFSPLSHINDPEVFIVNYSNAINFGGGDTQNNTAGTPADMTGVYATNPQVAEWVRQRYSVDADPVRSQMEQDTSSYKKKVIRAPQWLNLAYIKQSKDTNNQGTSIIESQRVNTKEESGKDPEDKEASSGREKDYKHGRFIADELAKAIYAMQYGSTYKADVELSPKLLFGGGGVILENCIGELVDIVPKDEKDKHLAIRGMIEGLHFDYSAGRSASCNYHMIISHMRPRNEEEKSIVCPLYIKKSDVDPLLRLKIIVKEAKEALAAAGIE